MLLIDQREERQQNPNRSQHPKHHPSHVKGDRGKTKPRSPDEPIHSDVPCTLAQVTNYLPMDHPVPPGSMYWERPEKLLPGWEHRRWNRLMNQLISFQVGKAPAEAPVQSKFSWILHWFEE